jgi:cystathionine beta-synthase
VAKRIARETPDSYYVNQYENKWNVEAHYTNTGPEIWEQTDGQMTHFVVGLGTCGTFTGCSKFFKETDKKIQCVGVDPEGSVFHNYWKTGELGEAFVYKVEGIGKDLLVGIMDFTLIDDIVKIGDKESFLVARQMAREEGIFAGGSAGTAVAGALDVARRAPKGSVIVVILPDNGARYVSKFYSDEWMRDNQFIEHEVKLGYVKDLISQRKPHEIYSVNKNDLVGDVITQLRAHGISQMPVYGENRQMLGIINEADLLQFMVSDIGSASSVIEPIMQTKFPVVKEETPLDEVSSIFKVGHDAVMVERSGGNADILTKIDLIEYLAARAAKANGNGKP